MYSTRKHNNWNTASATYVRTYIRSTSVHRKATNKFTSRHMLGTSKRIRTYVCTHVLHDLRIFAGTVWTYILCIRGTIKCSTEM